jgi:lipopolysaccharide transport system permease protein
VLDTYKKTHPASLTNRSLSYLLTILWQFSRRNVEQRLRGSVLGIVWLPLSPLLSLGLYMLVFGYIFGGSYGVVEDETKLDYAFGIFLGLSLMWWISNTLAAAPMAIVGQPTFVKRVVFPIEVLPASEAVGSSIQAMISLGLCLIGVAVWGDGLGWPALWLIYLLPCCGLLAFGIAWIFSALGVFFRDVGQVTPLLSMALLYSSGVFYAVEQVPSGIWAWLRFNPLIHAIDTAHQVVLWGGQPSTASLLYLGIASVGVCALGYFFFMKVQRSFADLL